MSVRARASSGGYTISENWYHICPKFSGTYRPIIFLHGAGGEENALEPRWSPNASSVGWFLARFYSVFCPDARDLNSADGSHTWGTDGSTDTLNNAITYAQATTDIQMASGPVILLATSMGMITACNYLRRFSSMVAGIVAVAGATDVDYHYANGYSANIDAAYGGNWATSGKQPVSHSPLDFASTLKVPLRYYYATDDTTVPPTGTGSYGPFLAAYGGSRKEAVSMGTGGHTDTPWANIDKQDLLRFVGSL